MGARLAEFTHGWRFIQQVVHDNAVEKGFWERDRRDAECIALIHSEVSELLEAIRANDPDCEKAILVWDDEKGDSRRITAAEEEMADIIIRVMDYAQANGYTALPEAIVAKHLYNRTRPHKHGKEF